MNILIIGANGQVGSELVARFLQTPYRIIAFTRRELDCCHVEHLEHTLSDLALDLVINASAYTAVDKAEEEMGLAEAVNSIFVRHLAHFCSNNKIPLIHLSTDYVFDGSKAGVYKESDIPNPLGAYGQSKWAGEQAIMSQLKQHIILRVSWVFGLNGQNFVKTILKLASAREELKIVADQWGRPTSARDIAEVLLNITQHIKKPQFKQWGIYHYAGDGVTNWYEFAQSFTSLAKEMGYPMALKRIIPISSAEYPVKAKRPQNSVLCTEKIEEVFAIHCNPWMNFLPELINQEETYALSI